MQNNLIKKLDNIQIIDNIQKIDNIQRILLQKDDNDVLIDMNRKIIVFPNVEYVTNNLSKINFYIFGITGQPLTNFVYHTKSSNQDQDPANKEHITIEKHSLKNGLSTPIQNNGINVYSEYVEKITLYEKLVPNWNDNKYNLNDDFRQVYKNIMESEAFKKATENSKDAKGGNIRGHNTRNHNTRNHNTRGHNTRGRNIRGGGAVTIEDYVPSDELYTIIENNTKLNDDQLVLIQDYLKKLKELNSTNNLDILILGLNPEISDNEKLKLANFLTKFKDIFNKVIE